MSKIKIVTDSTIDLPKHLLEEYKISVVPLTVTIDGDSFIDDRISLTQAEFIQRMKAAQELPKTSQPSVGRFLEVYDALGQDGSEIMSIHMTETLSGTVLSAQSAANLSSSKVTVVDSKFISCALGFQVLEAVKAAKEGLSVSEIVNRLQRVRENTNLYIMVDTLENLVKGGRIGRGTALIGSLLKIKPIAALKEGIYTPVAKVRSYPQVLTYFKDTVLDKIKENKTIKRAGIAHIEAKVLAEKIKQTIIESTGFDKIDVMETGPIIGTHTGPGAVALMFQTE